MWGAIVSFWQRIWPAIIVLLLFWAGTSFSLPSMVPEGYRAMGPALPPGKWYVVDYRPSRTGAWRQGQVVRLREPWTAKGSPSATDNPRLVRIAAVEGQSISIQEGKVHVDGSPYAVDGFVPIGAEEMPEIRVPSGHVFLLVDYGPAAASSELDGRAYGVTPVQSIEGVAIPF